jgi:hypothetical protein
MPAKGEDIWDFISRVEEGRQMLGADPTTCMMMFSRYFTPEFDNMLR